MQKSTMKSDSYISSACVVRGIEDRIMEKSNMQAKCILIFLLISTFFCLFGHTLEKLVHDWVKYPNYSHGILIPFISAFMVWKKRVEIKEVSLRPSGWGLLILVIALILHVLGNVAAELFTMRLSMILALFGLVVYLLGWNIARLLGFPILYLVFMVPIPSIIWNKLAFPLQLFSSKMATFITSNMGVPIFREGNVLHLTNTTLEVLGACSGLRSLTAFLSLSAAFAYFIHRDVITKWILFLLAIPVALVLNVFRLSLTVFLAEWFGPSVAKGFLHEVSGMVIFVIGLAFFMLLFSKISKSRPSDESV